MEYIDALYECYKNDKNIIVITAENRALLRNLENKYPEIPYIDVGIAEQTAIGVAAGLAKSGRKPIVHGLASFITMRSYEFIRTDIGLAGLDVKIVGFIPGFLSEANGPTHQAVQDIALMQTIPGINIFTPTDYVDMVSSLQNLINFPGASYIRAIHTTSKNNYQTDNYNNIQLIREGQDCAVITYGILVDHAIELERQLRLKNINCAVYNVRSIKPLDKNLLKSLLKKNIPLIIIEDHFEFGSLYSLILNQFQKEFPKNKILGVNLKEDYHKPIPLKLILEEGKFSIENLILQIENLLEI